MVLVIDMNTRAVIHASGKDDRRSAAKELVPAARPAEEDPRLELNVFHTAETTEHWVPGLLPDGGDDDPTQLD